MKIAIKLLAEMQTKPADKQSNGYYIVTEYWNTCFHRWAHNLEDRIEVRQNNKPSTYHTYTRIPVSLKENIWFLYVNCKPNEGFKVYMEDGDLVVGGYDPQESGGYLNYSFLLYCKTPPCIEKCEFAGFYIEREQHPPIAFRLNMLCPPFLNVRSFQIKNNILGCKAV